MTATQQTTTTAGINVREVTDVDRRTARRLGMTPEQVNEVISTWAGEYLAYERDQAKLSTAANPPAKKGLIRYGLPDAAKKAAAAKAAPAKPARAPRKAAAKAETPKFDKVPTDGHDYIPITNRADADCMECGAKEAQHVEGSSN